MHLQVEGGQRRPDRSQEEKEEDPRKQITVKWD